MMRGHASQADRASLERGYSSELPLLHTVQFRFVGFKPGDLKNPSVLQRPVAAGTHTSVIGA